MPQELADLATTIRQAGLGMIFALIIATLFGLFVALSAGRRR